jgi:DNA-binding NarL/FixJ family response regulator
VSADEQPLRILIVDDDVFFRRGLREILNEAEGIQVVGEAADGQQAIQLARTLRPRGLDLVLIDTRLPRLDGIATAERLVDADPTLAVVMLSLSSDDSDLFAALAVGALGYLSKTLAPEAVVRALVGFRRGESLPMSRGMAEKVLGALRHRASQSPSERDELAPPQSLTAREKEVFELIAGGARDRDIANRLVVSVSTVKKHVQNILRKLHARNRAQAIAALRNRG